MVTLSTNFFAIRYTERQERKNEKDKSQKRKKKNGKKRTILSAVLTETYRNTAGGAVLCVIDREKRRGCGGNNSVPSEGGVDPLPPLRRRQIALTMQTRKERMVAMAISPATT